MLFDGHREATTVSAGAQNRQTESSCPLHNNANGGHKGLIRAAMDIAPILTERVINHTALSVDVEGSTLTFLANPITLG